VIPLASIQTSRPDLSYQVRLPQPFACAEQLITRRARHDEVLRKVDAPNTVKPADERLPTRMVDPCQHRTDEERPKPPLIQTRAHEVGERLGADVALLSQSVHVHFVAEEVGYRQDVCRQTCQAEVDAGAVLEDFREVVRYCERLKAQAEIAGDRYAVFADHGHAGAAVDVEGGGLGLLLDPTCLTFAAQAKLAHTIVKEDAGGLVGQDLTVCSGLRPGNRFLNDLGREAVTLDVRT
jgi:hypothetical protein